VGCRFDKVGAPQCVSLALANSGPAAEVLLHYS
jgi:hypothetical protein